MLQFFLILLFTLPAFAQSSDSSSSESSISQEFSSESLSTASLSSENDSTQGSSSQISSEQSSISDSVPSSLSSESAVSDFYAPYARVLDKYVDLRGKIDYTKLKETRADLDSFIDNLKQLSQDNYDTWDDGHKIAFWINSYNALTIKVVIEHYPIMPSAVNTLAFPSNSIRQIVGAWTGIKHEVMGRSVTLDEIQHSILREQFSEPRIHFALSPASMGGPRLRREVYNGANLDNQLTDQSKYFLREAAKFFLDKKQNQILISPIFDWYAADFEKNYTSTPQYKRYTNEMTAILKFLSLHLAEADLAFLNSRAMKISFLEYNWELNDQKPRG